MQPVNTHLFHPSGAGTICRVIRQGAAYYCGMCRTAHGSFSHALNCVRECWEEVLSWDPVIMRRYGRGKVHYRCRFCARDHASRDLASQCAADCRERFKIRFALELEAWGQVEDLTGKPAGKKRIRTSLQLVPMTVVRKKPPKDSVTKESSTTDASKDETMGGNPAHTGKDTPPPQDSQPAANSAAKSESTAASVPPAKEKRAPREPFSRDGAQYVCNGCQKKYFTKSEVVTCFESHGNG